MRRAELFLAFCAQNRPDSASQIAFGQLFGHPSAPPAQLRL